MRRRLPDCRASRRNHALGRGEAETFGNRLVGDAAAMNIKACAQMRILRHRGRITNKAVADSLGLSPIEGMIAA